MERDCEIHYVSYASKLLGKSVSCTNSNNLTIAVVGGESDGGTSG